IIKQHLNAIYKINIEGHTDIYPTRRYPGGNLELGARRAMSVFEHFQQVVGIDPITSLMSATSFGEYKPVTRLDTTAYSVADLNSDNATDELRGQNRRVELLLFYRR